MAKQPKNSTTQTDIVDDFASELIKEINKKHNEKVAFNLSSDDAPTNIHRWVSTGSKQLNYILSNVRDGGLPEGRIIEIQGPPSIGKSHIGFEIAKHTQRMGGIVVYIDTENADVEDLVSAVRHFKNKSETKKNDRRYGYNAAKGTYGDLVSEGIIDPVKVTRFALQHAVSVIGLTLSCNSVIVNEEENWYERW